MKSTPKKKLIKKFDPNGVGQKGRLFGLPFDYDSSQIIVIPVPWDVTASFKDGASAGPNNVLRVSSQIDLYMPSVKDAWKYGIHMLPIDDEWVKKNDQAQCNDHQNKNHFRFFLHTSSRQPFDLLFSMTRFIIRHFPHLVKFRARKDFFLDGEPPPGYIYHAARIMVSSFCW